VFARNERPHFGALIRNRAQLQPADALVHAGDQAIARVADGDDDRDRNAALAGRA